MADAEEIMKIKWFHYISSQEIDYLQIKNILLSILTKFCDETYALYIIYSLFADNMFISGVPSEVIPILNQLLPRLCHLKVKVPFKDSYFPYKNENGELIQT